MKSKYSHSVIEEVIKNIFQQQFSVNVDINISRDAFDIIKEYEHYSSKSWYAFYEAGKMYYHEEGNLLIPAKYTTQASLKMYFEIYSCMRKGKCYKMRISAAFTQFLIEKIYEELGRNALLFALSAAKQNSDYRIRCGNAQPGIETVCRKLMKKYDIVERYEELDQHYNNCQVAPKEVEKGTAISQPFLGHEQLKLDITYGTINFHAYGSPELVLSQLKETAKQIIPSITEELEKIASNTPAVEKQDSNTQESVGDQLRRNNDDIGKLKSKIDFKAKMIPILYLATPKGLQTDFSISEIQVIMQDSIQGKVSKKQIEDVFERRKDWFEIINNNPRRYILLDIAKDYARNILEE